MHNPKELFIAFFWLAVLGMAVIAGGQVMQKVQSSVKRAL